jgi:hypothetical protein
MSFAVTTKGTSGKYYKKNQLNGAEEKYRGRGNTTGLTELKQVDWKMVHSAEKCSVNRKRFAKWVCTNINGY